MEAVILSGGLGTRLRPLTYTTPKPLLPVANRPMVVHLLDRLPDAVDRAILAAGYKVDRIRAFAEQLDHRVELVVVDEDEPLGTGGAIKNVEDEITGPFLCFNGDVLSTAPLDAMIEKRRGQDAEGVLALWEVDDPSPFGVVDLDGDRITRFVEKPSPGEAPSRLINAGTYCFDASVLDRIPAGRKVSLEREIFPELLQTEGGLYGHPFDGYWVDCGRPEVYLDAHRILLDGELLLGQRARMEGAWGGWACLGTDAEVEAGARVDRSVLFDGARVASGAHLEQTILGHGVTVGKDARLSGCVVADGLEIEPGAELTGERVGGGVDTPPDEGRFEEVR